MRRHDDDTIVVGAGECRRTDPQWQRFTGSAALLPDLRDHASAIGTVDRRTRA